MYDWQKQNGKLPQIAPPGGIDFFMSMMNGSVGWSDAGIIIPYYFWKQYGDRDILAKYYDRMKKYAEFMISRVGKNAPLSKPHKVKGEDGELCVYGPTLMQGYWNDPDKTAKMLIKHDDGRVWLHTGDMCYITPETGDIYYRQRLKRVYKISGYLVYPSFIEESYRAMAEIYDCCAIGTGEEGNTQLKLYVVKNKKYANDEEKLKKKIIEFGMQNLSKWSVPKEIVYIDELPRTKIGKVDFKVLK